MFLTIALYFCAFCAHALQWKCGIDAGVAATATVGEIKLDVQQDYRAAYDYSEHYQDRVFSNVAENGVSGIFHNNTLPAMRYNYLMHGQAPQQIMDDFGVLRDVGPDFYRWLLRNTGGCQSVQSSNVSIEGRASSALSVWNPGVLIKAHVECLFEKWSFGLWIGHMYSASSRDDVHKMFATVLKDDEVFGQAKSALSISVVAKAYEVFGSQMLKGKMNVNFQEYFRIGSCVGWRVSDRLMLDLSAGVRYINGVFALRDITLLYPYAHRTYDLRVAGSRGEKAHVSLENISVDNKVWAPVVGLFVRYDFSDKMTGSLGFECSWGDVDAQFKSKKSVKNPLQGITVADLQNADGWHMIYVPSLKHSVKASCSFCSFSFFGVLSVSV
ncbi:MAG: hypothetical protein OXC30_03880 [Alphaproteobacteria bacterium]|nr:hypothetical protein [Alphaproteobacteria bacterium]